LKFYSSVRLDIRKIATLKDGQDVTGSRTRVRVVKNKVAPPFKEAEFDIVYGKGISHLGEVLDLGVKTEIIEKAGTWFSYGDDRLGQGRDNSKNYLEENAKLAAEIEKKIRVKLGIIDDGDKPKAETEAEPDKGKAKK
jgi:recombination protein RecA